MLSNPTVVLGIGTTAIQIVESVLPIVIIAAFLHTVLEMILSTLG